MKFTDPCTIDDDFVYTEYYDPTKTKEGCRMKFVNEQYFGGFSRNVTKCSVCETSMYKCEDCNVMVCNMCDTICDCELDGE